MTSGPPVNLPANVSTMTRRSCVCVRKGIPFREETIRAASRSLIPCLFPRAQIDTRVSAAQGRWHEPCCIPGMANTRRGLLSRFPRATERSVTIIDLDGRVIQAEDPASRLNRLINEALGRDRLDLRMTPDRPVELYPDDSDPLLLEVRAALQFAKKAS